MPTAAEQAARVSSIQEMLETLIDNPDEKYGRRALFAGSKFKRWQQDVIIELLKRGVIKKSGKPNNPVYQIVKPEIADAYIEQRVPLSQLAYPNHQPPSAEPPAEPKAVKRPVRKPVKIAPAEKPLASEDDDNVPPEVVAQHTLKLLPVVIEQCVALQTRISGLEKKIDYLTSLWTSSE